MTHNFHIILKKLRECRYHLLFTFLFWGIFFWSFTMLSPEVEDAKTLQKLNKAHHQSLSYLSQFLEFERCDNRFPKDRFLEKVSLLHEKINSIPNIDINKVGQGVDLILARIELTSVHPDISRKIITKGYLLNKLNSHRCFGILY